MTWKFLSRKIFLKNKKSSDSSAENFYRVVASMDEPALAKNSCVARPVLRNCVGGIQRRRRGTMSNPVMKKSSGVANEKV